MGSASDGVASARDGIRQFDAAPGQRFDNSRRDIVDVAESIDRNEHTATVVDIDERLGLLAVYVESVPNDGLVIVCPALLKSPLAQSVDDDIGIRDEFYDRIKRCAVRLEELVELANLVDSAGVAV